MKKIIKYPLIGLGILFTLVIVFIILVLCGVFHHERPPVCGAYFLAQELENQSSSPENEGTGKDVWIEEPDTIRRVPGYILHRFLASHDDGFIKEFNSKGSQKFYYNSRHGYYVLLPDEMGYLQQGESQLGAHGNEFYNSDTTLVISCYGLFYDVLLEDYPHYEDTVRNRHLEWLNGKH